MIDVRRCLIVTAANQVAAQNLCAALAGQSGTGMFRAGLSTTGNLPATHYISEGFIPTVLSDNAELLALVDVSQDTPVAAMTRLNLKLIV